MKISDIDVNDREKIINYMLSDSDLKDDEEYINNEYGVLPRKINKKTDYNEKNDIDPELADLLGNLRKEKSQAFCTFSKIYYFIGRAYILSEIILLLGALSFVAIMVLSNKYSINQNIFIIPLSLIILFVVLLVLKVQFYRIPLHFAGRGDILNAIENDVLLSDDDFELNGKYLIKKGVVNNSSVACIVAVKLLKQYSSNQYYDLSNLLLFYIAFDYLYRSNSYENKDSVSDICIEVLNKILAYRQNNTSLLFFLGFYLVEKEKYVEAINCFDKIGKSDKYYYEIAIYRNLIEFVNKV